MESKRIFTSDTITIDKLDGNGQCQCTTCRQICWTSWFYHYDNKTTPHAKTLCHECLKKELEEDLQVIHASIDTNKVLYAERHLQILELQKQERKDLKNIIKGQNEELKLSDFYREHFMPY